MTAPWWIATAILVALTVAARWAAWRRPPHPLVRAWRWLWPPRCPVCGRRRRHLRPLHESSERIWQQFDRALADSTHPGTWGGRVTHGAGAMAYFAARQHDHRPGRRCRRCSWPSREDA